MIPTVKLICSSFSSVIATLQASMRPTVRSRCVKSPRHLSHTMSADGITSTTRVASCSTTHLSRRQELVKFRSFVNLVSGRWLTDPVTRSCLVRAGLTSIKGDEHKPFYRSRLVVQEYKRKADGSFFTATPPLEALQILICGTIDELPNEMGQPVACTEPVVLMLMDVRSAHFYSAARRKVFVELPEEACRDKSKFERLLRSMHGCRDAGVNWEFAICQVMIAFGFVQGRASRCIFCQTSCLSVTSSTSGGSL